jgi:hypothetical protein
MKSIHVLFDTKVIERKSLPYYYGYGKIVSTLQEKLMKDVGMDFIIIQFMSFRR